MRTFDRVFINEYEEAGRGRIQNFTIDYWDGNQWNTAHTGTTIGELFSQGFTAVTGSKLRLNITNAIDAPSIWDLRIEFSNKAYSDWRKLHFPSQIDKLISSNTADPDGDSIPNKIEYLTGSNPNTKTSLPLAKKINHDSYDWAQWTVPLNSQNSSNELEIQYSYDLNTWINAVTEADGSIISTKTNSNWIVEVKMNSEKQCFFRLHANNSAN